MVWANFALRRRFLREDFSRRQPERLVSNSRRPSAGLFPQPRIFRATIGSMPEISTVKTPIQSRSRLRHALFVAGKSLIISVPQTVDGPWVDGTGLIFCFLSGVGALHLGHP